MDDNTKVQETDVIVLGVGTCGEDLSLRLLGAGMQVVGIEASLVGGECAYWACLPSKMMIRTAGLLQESRRADGKAGRVTAVPDWGMLAERVRKEVTGGWDDSYAVARFESRGGRLIHARGRLTGAHTVKAGGEYFSARRGIVIATGSRPFIPSIPGLDESGFWTTHDVIAAEQPPESLIVLGGGTVGCELGQLLARFGVQVTIVEARERLLSLEEPEASTAVESALKSEGVAILTGASVVKVEVRAGRTIAALSDGREISAERLLVAAGRRVDLSSLGLENVGLDGTASFLEVDENMRAADGIWGMGDVTGKAMFTHMALHQSSKVAAEFLGLEHPPVRYDVVPRVTFTDPEVGAAGMTEAQARASGMEVLAITKQLASTFRGWLHGADHGVIKLIVDRDSGLLAGATTVGPRGGDVLGMLALAIHARVPVAELQNMVYPFPSFYAGIGEAIGAYGRGLSTVIDPAYRGFDILDEVLKS